LVVLALSSLALGFMGHPALRSFAFTVWVFAFVAGAMYYPLAFDRWFEFDLKFLIVPLIQIIMFGMGTTLSLMDFGRVFTMPWPVFIGMLLQFLIMPLAGYSIATTFGFDAEVAAGVILIGSCPGGVASNLMTYLARGNVALSVTMTSCSTLMSPIMTPLMMKVLAGRLVPIDFMAMMISILNMVIVPILAGLVANTILYSRRSWVNRAGPLALTALLWVLISTLMLLAGDRFLEVLLPPDLAGILLTLKSGTIIGFGLIGLVALLKLIVNVLLEGPKNWMDRALPVVSMAGICFIIAIITARSREKLLTVGLALILAAVCLNFVGYVLGYWCARLARLNKTACRTVAIEVGLQNGGMASGLAMNVLQSAHAALAPAIFGPWMNISGSVLATWWHRKPLTEELPHPDS
jgi:BASS family bile acid:Na+ symporter